MSFSSSWLALRSDADRRARPTLTTRLTRLTEPMRRPLRVIDIGSGTGATVRELFPHIRPPQDWTLVDADPELLAIAKAQLAGHGGLRIATHVADLRVEPLWTEPPDVVTASAVFDITSQEFVDRLARALAAHKIPFLSMLTYDGRLAITPEHPFDETVIEAFNAHQRGEKSFGPALGPAAADALTTALRAVGATVEEADSAWSLQWQLDPELMQATLDGFAAAATEILPERADEVAAWRRDRKTVSTIFVGHRDHFATF